MRRVGTIEVVVQVGSSLNRSQQMICENVICIKMNAVVPLFNIMLIVHRGTDGGPPCQTHPWILPPESTPMKCFLRIVDGTRLDADSDDMNKTGSRSKTSCSKSFLSNPFKFGQRQILPRYTSSVLLAQDYLRNTSLDVSLPLYHFISTWMVHDLSRHRHSVPPWKRDLKNIEKKTVQFQCKYFENVTIC